MAQDCLQPCPADAAARHCQLPPGLLEAAVRDLTDGFGKQLSSLLADPSGPLRLALREELGAELARHRRLACARGTSRGDMDEVESGTLCEAGDLLSGCAAEPSPRSYPTRHDAIQGDLNPEDNPSIEGSSKREEDGQNEGIDADSEAPATTKSARNLHSMHLARQDTIGLHRHGTRYRSCGSRVSGEQPRTWCQQAWEQYASFCSDLVHSRQYFELFMGLVIVANCMLVGLETQFSIQEDDSLNPDSLDVAEHVFLVVFAAELLVRYGADGNECFKSGWFKLDLFLVSLGVLAMWIVAPALSASNSSSSEVKLVQDALLARALRLLRLARTLRMLESMKDFFRLANGLVSSMRTVISASVLIFIMVFVLGCVGVEVITKSDALQADPAAAEIIRTNFSSLGVTMLTLLQFANADSISAVYLPLVKIHWSLAIYFGIVWLSITVSLMNIIGALLVLNAINDAKVDAEMEEMDMRRKLKRLVPQLKRVFTDLDVNKDGALDISELCAALGHIEPQHLPQELRDLIRPDKLVDLFEFLDMDNSGKVDEREFVQGVSHLALSSVPIEATQTLNLLKLVMRSIEDHPRR